MVADGGRWSADGGRCRYNEREVLRAHLDQSRFPGFEAENHGKIRNILNKRNTDLAANIVVINQHMGHSRDWFTQTALPCTTNTGNKHSAAYLQGVELGLGAQLFMVPYQNEVLRGGSQAGQDVRLKHFSCLLHYHHLCSTCNSHCISAFMQEKQSYGPRRSRR